MGNVDFQELGRFSSGVPATPATSIFPLHYMDLGSAHFATWGRNVGKVFHIHFCFESGKSTQPKPFEKLARGQPGLARLRWGATAEIL